MPKVFLVVVVIFPQFAYSIFVLFSWLNSFPSNVPTQAHMPKVFLVLVVVFPQLAYSVALRTERYWFFTYKCPSVCPIRVDFMFLLETWIRSSDATRYSNYLRLQLFQSECLRVIGNHHRGTPHFPPAQISKHRAHPRAHPPPYWQIFRSLTPLTPQNPPPTPVQKIWNYTLADLTNLYTKYKHKRTKHILL